MTDPAYIYDPENWDVTYPWEERDQLAEDIEVHFEWDRPVRLRTLIQGPDKWVANVVLTRDEDGDPDETEVQWFDTGEAAIAAMRGPGFV